MKPRRSRPRFTLAFLFAGFVANGSVTAQEGTAVRTVRDLRFTGNEYISDEELRASIATSRSGFMGRTPVLRWFGMGRKPLFDESTFRRDVLRIQALYAARGFPDVALDTVLERSADHVEIDVEIKENAPIRITELDVQGASQILDDVTLLSALPLHVGDPLDRLEYGASIVRITALLQDRGYPFVAVSANIAEHPHDKTAEITFTVRPGPRATVGEIEVVGTVQIDERVVLQSMTFAAGAPFSAQSLYDSQLALFRTNLFTYVDVSLADTIAPEVPADSVVSVRVNAHVIESTLRSAQVGVGYGTLDCFRTRASLDLLNFAGSGRSLELTGRLSQLGAGDPLAAGFDNSVCPALSGEDPGRLKLNYHLGATLREPLLFARSTNARFGLYAERHTEINAFLRETIRGEASITRNLAPDVPLTLTYAISYGRTAADPATFCIYLDICRVIDTQVFASGRRRSMFSINLTRNTTGSLLDPEQGTTLHVGVDWSSRILGSDTLEQFVRAEVEFASYHGMGGHAVFAWRIRGGFISAPRRQLARGPERFVPPEERYYAGGPGTVRGFSQNQLGPVTRVLESVDTVPETPDSVIRTSATGGSQILLANTEVRFPLGFMDGLTGSVFVDAGWIGDGHPFEPGDIKVTPGIGTRVITPIGPVGVDLAVNFHERQASPLYVTDETELVLSDQVYQPERGFLGRFRLHFSVGQAF